MVNRDGQLLRTWRSHSCAFLASETNRGSERSALGRCLRSGLAGARPPPSSGMISSGGCSRCSLFTPQGLATKGPMHPTASCACSERSDKTGQRQFCLFDKAAIRALIHESAQFLHLTIRRGCDAWYLGEGGMMSTERQSGWHSQSRYC